MLINIHILNSFLILQFNISVNALFKIISLLISIQQLITLAFLFMFLLFFINFLIIYFVILFLYKNKYIIILNNSSYINSN